MCVCNVAASAAAKCYWKSGLRKKSGSTPGGVYACVQTPGYWLVLVHDGVASEGNLPSYCLLLLSFLTKQADLF